MSQLELEESAGKRPRPDRSAVGVARAAIVPLVVAGLLLAGACTESPGNPPGAPAAAGTQQAQAAPPVPTNSDEAVAPGPPPGRGGAPDAEPRGAGRGLAEHPDELILPPAKGRLLHISPTAQPGGDGSEERPWNDLQAALRALEPGDRLMLLRGSYVGPFVIDASCKDGTAQAPIEVAAHVDALLTAGGAAAVLKVQRSGWSLLGLEILAGNATAALEVAGARDLLVFRGHFHEGEGDGVHVETGSERVTIAQTHIHGFGPAGGPPRERHEVTGLRIAPGTRGITMVGSKLQNIAGPPVKVLTPAEYGPGPQGKLLPAAADLKLEGATVISNWPEKN